MAKKAYVGVDNVARKIKSGYVGVRTAFPIYQTQTTTETVTINSDTLLSKYFTVSNGSYGFVWNSSYNQFRSSNSGIASSTATTTITALQDCTVTYTYNYGTEVSYDKFSLTVKGTAIHSTVSGVGTPTTRTDTLTKGQTIVFTYSKDTSVDNNGDYAAFYSMSATVTTTKEVQVGTDYRNVARKIKKAYIGVDGVAKLYWGGLVWNKYTCDLHYTDGLVWIYNSAVSVGNSSSTQGSGYLFDYVYFSNSTGQLTFKNAYDSFTFSESEGYIGGGGPKSYSCTSLSEAQAIESKYFIHAPNDIFQIDVESYSYYNKTVSLGNSHRMATVTYTQGDSKQGVVVTEEGAIPTEGELIEGSIDAGYCVLKIDSSYYYYVLEV